ncbi:hypothetical protein GCM10010495_09600 [Kitasatospora herbaricolor]|nr:hypothetical protein GCM10010495_09600 [Kitasatospora herbaricolor]
MEVAKKADSGPVKTAISNGRTSGAPVRRAVGSGPALSSGGDDVTSAPGGRSGPEPGRPGPAMSGPAWEQAPAFGG